MTAVWYFQPEGLTRLSCLAFAGLAVGMGHCPFIWDLLLESLRLA